jgi:hypothetical protein
LIYREQIPNSLYEILTKYPDKSICYIKKEYNNKYDEIIDDYFEFLLKNEFAFRYTEQEIKHFPPLNLEWRTSSIIENAIIVVNLFIESRIQKIFTELSQLRCDAV